MLFLQSIVFSTWLVKEIAAGKNIKDRSNRQNVSRLLTILDHRLGNINLFTCHDRDRDRGLFCFVGINEYGDEIIEIFEPDIKLDLFYYSCANKFQTCITNKYIGVNIEGTIVFANGDECLGYQCKHGRFVKIFGLNGNLVKRHSKGGFSANRFARIAEESRHFYVVRICDRLNDLVNSTNSTNSKELNIHIFGSSEIVSMVIKQSSVKLIDCGFLNFNSTTINNTRHWLELLTKSSEKNYDTHYAKILEYLELDPDMLDFDPVNKDTMEYYIEKKPKNPNKLNSNQIPLIISSKYYAQLMIFEYIGVKFFNYQTEHVYGYEYGYEPEFESNESNESNKSNEFNELELDNKK